MPVKHCNRARPLPVPPRAAPVSVASMACAVLVMSGLFGTGCSTGNLPTKDDLRIGRLDGEYILREDQLCTKDRKLARRVFVDVDDTAVLGNFITGVRPVESARRALNSLDELFGVLFLTASFETKKIDAFFHDNAYPEVPLFTRPLPLIKHGYSEWCMQAEDYYVCDYIYKMGQMQYMRGQCKAPPRLAGLGDRFSDYAVYFDAGVCPFIVPSASQTAINAVWKERCDAGPSGDYYYWKNPTYRSRRCPIVPQRAMTTWEDAPGLVSKYLNGEIDCPAFGAP
jgi:hypothetical protein